MNTRFYILITIILLTMDIAQSQNTPTTLTPSLVDKLISGRDFFDGLGKIYPPSSNVTTASENINGISTYWFAPSQTVNNNIIVFLHGGGYAWGSITSHRAMVSHIAESLAIKTLLIEYALSPERPYPHGLNDVVTVYRALLKKFPSTSFILIGDSAGAGLSIATIDKLQQEKLPLPIATILISPWINLEANTASYTTHADIDPILSRESVLEYAAAYNPNHRQDANTANLKFTSFPPTLILVGTREILLDDSKIFFEKIKLIQRNAALQVYDGETHVWPLSDINSKSSQKALRQMREFLNRL
ncbi:alpha/beta hydrolase fold domain-containing protein [Pseudochryseolinea flava]|uniref:Alpha/beta hydrolase fold-3 domain-containing protein n=1 Tax=Pseudochryseolinea flava TaxID=2059302 RepID=A0A364XVL7_9BACT|nr:alpha/beta hydrolase [Pseudochryseolinea flava]RAV98219.1 hypothetical protein DQQ10_24760 [Pseudochryseolinea flava]